MNRLQQEMIEKFPVHYPKDNTSGCTAEACNFRDNYAALSAGGTFTLPRFDFPAFPADICRHEAPASYRVWGASGNCHPAGDRHAALPQPR